MGRNIAVNKIFYFRSDLTIKSIDPERRGCLFSDEGNLQLFQEYSFNNCIMECSIEWAKEQDQTQCIPWYLPRSNDSQVESCDPWKMIQFQNESRKIDHNLECGHCLPDCDMVKYSTSHSSARFEYGVIMK